MHETAVFISIVVDILAIIGILYVVLTLRKSEKKVKKSPLTLKFERTNRERIFRNSLWILAFSFLFSFGAFFLSVFHQESDFLFPHETGEKVIEGLHVVSKVLLFIFIVYIIQSTAYAAIKAKASG